MRKGLGAFIGLAALILTQAPARAHPHVFIDVEMELDVADDGVLRAIRYNWTFDDMYSAFAVQGLPRANGAPTGAALEGLAGTLVEKLDDVDYFTRAAAEDHELQTTGAQEARATLSDGRLILSFAVPLRSLKGSPAQVNVQVFDPQYIVAMNVIDGVRVRGPTTCRHTLVRPRPLDPADARQLNDSVRTNQLAPNFGAKLATVVALNCRAQQ